jgi:hypothetical protein
MCGCVCNVRVCVTVWGCVRCVGVLMCGVCVQCVGVC